MVKAQFKIQQMIFMLIAVFIFFILVGLFFLNIELKSLKSSASENEKEKTITSLKTITEMPELKWDYNSYCDYMCIDEDKVLAMSGIDYTIWPVSSIEIKKIYPYINENIICPAPNCNYYLIYDSGQQKNTEKYATYISLCKRIESNYDKCEIAKIILGVRKNE